jgi:cell division protein FtsB
VSDTDSRPPTLQTKQIARLATLVRDVLPLAILVLAILWVPVLIFQPQGLPRLRALEQELQQVESENHAIEFDIGVLRRRALHLRNDLASVEKAARTDFGLIRKSEIVIQMP